MSKKIIGIGNAIVDLLCTVDDDFLKTHDLFKGSMSLIDEKMAEKLSRLIPKQITCGGSVGNTIAALAQLNNNCDFIGKVANDNFGKKYIEEIEKTSTKFVSKNYSSDISAQSFVLITPDAQRTMCTFLGCASKILENDINEENFKNASILYLEGYLWDQPSTILALKKAIKLAKINNVKIAFSLSDAFCVSRHHEDFLQLIENDLDILFANEAEITTLLKQDFSLTNLNDFFSKNEKLIAAITRSEKGCVIFNNKNHLALNAEKIIKLIYSYLM